MIGRIALALAAVVAAGAVAIAPHWWEEVAVVEQGQVADRIVASGLVVPTDGIAEVAGPAEGRVVGVFARVGDRVEAGAELARIEIAADPVMHETITAPIAGAVIARHVDPGDSIRVASAGGTSPIFEIANPEKTEVRVEIEERDAARVTVGLTVTLTAPGGREELGTGVVARLSDAIDRRSLVEDARVRAGGAVRTVWVTWDAAAPGGPIGRRVEAVVRLPERAQVTRLPRRAIVVRDGRTVVDTRLLLWSREVPVAVGADDGAVAEVSGVAAGTTVFLH